MSYERMILAVTDFSPASANAAWRAAMLSCEHHAHLHLLQVVPAGRSPVHQGLESPIDPQLDDARLHLKALAQRLRSGLGARVSWEAVRGDAVHESMEAARDAHLLVIGSARRNTLRQYLMGTPAERLIRMSRIPVLVIKREAEHAYRKVLVPVDLAQDAEAAVAAALDFSRGANVEVFHALGDHHELSMRVADVAEPIIRRYRNQTERSARATLRAMIEAAGGTSRVRSSLGFGHAPSLSARVEAIMAPELVVIGKRHRSLLADFFLGSVTQRLLAKARADLLILPVQPKAPANANANALALRPDRTLQQSFWAWNGRRSVSG